jgi:hypothetical protein
MPIEEFAPPASGHSQAVRDEVWASASSSSRRDQAPGGCRQNSRRLRGSTAWVLAGRLFGPVGN